MPQIATLNERVACTDTQARLISIDVNGLQSVLLQNLGANAVEIGGQGVTYGTGYPIGVGTILAIGWQDFTPLLRGGSTMLEIWGICSAGLTASMQVFGYMRRD